MSEKKRYKITDDLSEIPSKELLQKLPNYFTGKSSSEQTAFLNYRFVYTEETESDFCKLADAYFEGALLILEDCINHNAGKKADILIFPILFNTIHGIELYLKAFNSLYPIYKKLQNCKDESTQTTRGHDIKQLCNTAIALVKNDDKEIYEEFQFILQFIDYLYEHTADMTFPRYPIDTNKNNQFYSGTHDNITIDLLCFKQWLIRVRYILNKYTYAIGCDVANMRDILSAALSDSLYY